MATDIAEQELHAGLGEINKYDFRTESQPVFKAQKGLSREIVCQISEMKSEPAWMRDFRLRSLVTIATKPMPNWAGKIGVNL